MAILSNVNGKFAVDSTGAIQFSGSAGTSGYILRSNGNAAPTWVDSSTVIGGPYLPLTGGTLSGALAGTSATFSGTITTPQINLNSAGGGIIDNQTANIFIQTPAGGGWIFRNGAPGYDEKMRIDSSGNVGIGTSSNLSGPLTVQSDGGANSIHINGRNNGTADESVISFYDFDGTTRKGYILQTGGNMYFATGGSSTAITIDSSQNVGIGTDSPGARIDIKGVAGSPATSGTTQNGILRIQNATNNNTLDIGQVAGSPYGTWLQAADKSDLNPTYTYPILLNPLGGNVGIGITAPASKLHVYKNGLSAVIGKISDANIFIDSGDYGNSTYNAQIAFGYYSNVHTYAPVAIGFIPTSGASQGKGDLTFNTRSGITDLAPSERMRITSDGNVGINLQNLTLGGFSPKLALKQTSDVVWGGINIESAVDDSVFALGNDGGRHQIGASYRATAGYKPIDIMTSGSIRMTVLANGDVGIGTTSPQQSLDTAGKIKVRDGGNTTIPSIQMGASGIDGLSLPTTNTVAFITNSTERMRIDTNGELDITGGGRILSSGGIFLGSNNNSNLLDDYEEGTFYATTNNDGVGAQFISRYTKIGQLVTYTVYLNGWSPLAAGNAIVVGFPFTAITSYGYGVGNVTHSTGILNCAGGYHGGTSWYSTQNNSIGQATWVVAATRYTMISGFYYTTS